MGASLRHTSRRDYASAEGDEILLEACDVTGTQSDAFANGGSRSYATVVPWDVPARLAISSMICICICFAVLSVPELYEYHRIPPLMLTVAVIAGLGVGAICVTAAIPKRVTRKSESLVIDFLLHSHKVPLSDVLELVVLRDGRQFWQLLRKWKVFPSGQKLRLFFGAHSNANSLCVLLTRRRFWSFVFCLEDPVQFLLDNQRPLSQDTTYISTMKCVLRQDESIDSEKIGTVPRGTRLKVLEQRGRRVMIKMEGGSDTGWMSYLTEQGVALLSKPKVKGEQGVPGTIGASEFSRTGGSAMELGLVGVGTGHE
jgi:hypothetical protein